MMADTQPVDHPNKVQGRFKKVFRGLGYALFLFLLAELGARVFWLTRGVPFFTCPSRIYRSFYPEVARLERHPFENGETCFDILLLGGSVMNTGYGDVEHVLRERLIRASGRCVRIHNLAMPAQTSLDSYYKYKHLKAMHFDLVLFYHGINEVRANNCPSKVFRKDYSHFSWYKLINDFERRADSRWFVWPYTVEFATVKVADRLGWSSRLPTHRPNARSLDDGCHVKTVASFRENIKRIIELAAERKERVLLMTFAYYLPDQYSQERFKKRQLDYTVHAYPVELWGKPVCVVAALKAHNAVIRSLALRFDELLFVDQERLIAKDRLFFNDICHLTHEGCERFVNNIMGVMAPLVSKQEADP